jgi:hypothetical protein
MSRKYYQMPYDETIDADIVKWMESLPKDRKAEMVRTAIRYYMAATGDNPRVFIPEVKVEPKLN